MIEIVGAGPTGGAGSTGREAAQRACRLAPDVVLMVVRMPEAPAPRAFCSRGRDTTICSGRAVHRACVSRNAAASCGRRASGCDTTFPRAS